MEGSALTQMITLYHGSTKIIEKPEFGKGNPRNDYGSGFYCTENLELAKEWAAGSRLGGFANAYELDASELQMLDLSDPGFGIMDWLALLVNNRIFGITSPLADEAKNYLCTHFLPDIELYDVIKGYRADDSYFTFAMDFLSSTISIRQLQRAMALGELGEQYMIKSRKAFSLLRYISSEPADGEIYYSKRLTRDKDARDRYLRGERNITRRADDIFMLDILRGEMKRGDARLQRIISI